MSYGGKGKKGAEGLALPTAPPGKGPPPPTKGNPMKGGPPSAAVKGGKDGKDYSKGKGKTPTPPRRSGSGGT